jgi:GNAT superfamily N-acetyltransferase
LVIEPLNPAIHDRAGFDCGEPVLNEYLKKTARQHAERDVGVTHVATREVGSSEILGYVTLALKTVSRDSLGIKGLARGDYGVVLIAQLAVAKGWQAKGIGKRLLYFALYKAKRLAEEVGTADVALDLLNEQKREYYEKRGFKPLKDNPNRLFISTKEIRKLPLDPRQTHHAD